jgi:hypothetical protein
MMTAIAEMIIFKLGFSYFRVFTKRMSKGCTR